MKSAKLMGVATWKQIQLCLSLSVSYDKASGWFPLLMCISSFCATASASPVSYQLGSDVFENSTNVILANVVSVEQKVDQSRLVYCYNVSGETVFKGESIPSPIKVAAISGDFMRNGVKYMPTNPYHVLLLLKQKDGLFEFSGRTVEQQLVEPTINVPPSSFGKFQDLLASLLASAEPRNRRIGLLFQGGYKTEEIQRGVENIRLSGDAGEKALVEAFSIQEAANLRAQKNSGAREEAIKLTNLWRTSWNAEDWESLVHLSEPLQRVWNRGEAQRRQIIQSLSDRRKKGEITNIDISSITGDQAELSAECSVYYSNGTSQKGTISFVQTIQGRWTIANMCFE